MNETLMNVMKAVVDLDSDASLAAVQNCLEEGVPAWNIVNEGLNPGMKEVGDLFEKGEYFLGDLVMAGNVVKDVMEVLEDRFDKAGAKQKGKIILATIKGDVHDLGKNIVGMMLDASGFDIIDLGTDVDADRIVEAVKKTGAGGIGLTMLLTTGIAALKEVGDALREAGLRDKVKVAIGGASTNQKLADDMGFEAYGENAAKAVRIFEDLLVVP